VGRIVLLAVRARVVTAVVVVAVAAVAVIVVAVVAAVMAVAVIVAIAVVAATVVVAPPAVVVIRSVSTQARVHRSPAAVARPMAIKPTATVTPGRRRDMTRAAVRATTHGVLMETATARATDTAGRAL
jgi:hypothetical protein